MRPTFLPILAVLALAAPAAAQPPDTTRLADLHNIARVDMPTLANLRTAPESRGRAYQGRNNGPEQTERFSRKVRVGRDGRVTVSNIAGDIIVNAGSGDEVSIEAVKRARGDSGQLSSVRIDVQERAGSVYVQTTHMGRNDHVSVDYTITMPASAAADVHSVSGNVKVTGIRGSMRAESVSGNVTATDTPKLEAAKSVSGDVTLSGVTTEGDLSAGSVSGSVSARNVKVHSLELGSVSGDLTATDVACDRLMAKSVSGNVEYSGAITKAGNYDINVHSGDVRLKLANPAGFVLNANSFSGSIRSDLPLTIGGDSSARDRDRGGRRSGMDNHSMRATYGDGSATLIVRTFSGDIVISKR
ncbi:MAG TPA: DUF4097 family beta strand repeat-containing protein [Vicinamibacterales bacterium]|jgi:DUF4097 and DUF4098 domain-containing protein YvlB